MKLRLLLLTFLFTTSIAASSVSRLQMLVGVNYSTINRITNTLIQKKTIKANYGIMFCYNCKYFEEKELSVKLTKQLIVKPLNKIIGLSKTNELSELSKACSELMPLLDAQKKQK